VGYNHRVVRVAVLLLIASACGKAPELTRQLDPKSITIGAAHMRTDRVGEGVHERIATFVLVDANNTASEGAYVTLDGQLLDGAGQPIAELLPHVLWVPPGETRTFALVEKAPEDPTEARPTPKSARARLRGTMILPAPLARIEDIRTHDDHGQLVLQAYLVNDAERAGQVLVTGVFHDAGGRPMTRPFYVVKIGAKKDGADVVGNCPDRESDHGPTGSKCTVQMIGPPGAKRGTNFVGDTMY
jgi:hypothetical protein